MKLNEVVENWINYSEIQREIQQKLEGELLKAQNIQLNLNEFYTLYFLNQEENKKIKLQNLGYKVGLSPSAMSRMIVKLEENSMELIKKEICYEDKRNLYVRMTPEGEEKLLLALSLVEKVLKDYENKF